MLLVRLKKNWYLLGISIAIVCGFLFPEIGRALNPGSLTSSSIVVLIFFISGLILPSEAVKKGITEVRLHLFIQSFIFVICPLYFFLSSLPFQNSIDPGLLVGIYALSCLPTTISSCTIFTQASGGNVVGTMFNAALANMAGVFISPVVLSILIRETGQSLPVSELLRILKSLGIKMLFPLLVGQGVRFYIKDFATRQKKRLGVVNNIAILFIVFFVLSGTADNPLFHENLKKMILPFGYLACSHLFLVFLAYFGSRLLKLGKENIISAIYAAPQKTMAVGVPLLTTYFAQDPAVVGIAILPLLFYHPWQLLIASILKDRAFLQRDGGANKKTV